MVSRKQYFGLKVDGGKEDNRGRQVDDNGENLIQQIKPITASDMEKSNAIAVESLHVGIFEEDEEEERGNRVNLGFEGKVAMLA